MSSSGTLLMWVVVWSLTRCQRQASCTYKQRQSAMHMDSSKGVCMRKQSLGDMLVGQQHRAMHVGSQRKLCTCIAAHGCQVGVAQAGNCRELSIQSVVGSAHAACNWKPCTIAA